MLKSAKSLISLSFLIVGVSLFLVIILGARQFQLNREYAAVSELSERTLFSFATIREQVTESLISRDYEMLKGIIPEIEDLNNMITRFLDSDSIPGQYKLSLTDRIDLTGLVIDLRKIGTEPDDSKTGLSVQQDLRTIGDNLFKIDRVITGQIRNSVVSFQLTIIGAMGLLISCASFVLILLYRKTISPIFHLSRQISTIPMERSELSCGAEVASEIVDITDSLNRIVAEKGTGQGANEGGRTEERETLSRTINETVNSLNTMINYAQLLLESEVPPSREQIQMLEQIIDSGERIADHWQSIGERFSS